jgi:DNA-binding NtrC family response regulator
MKSDNRKKLIYIVDDEPTILRLLESKIGEATDAAICTFMNGKSCLDALDEEPDIIVLDILMPGMDGMETLREIKTRVPDIPVIIISGQGNVDVAVQTLKLGAADYYTKPLEYERLAQAVKNMLLLKDLAQQVRQLQDSLQRSVHFENIITNDGRMREVLRMVDKVKDSTISVLVQGDSGTGKELIARAIHFNGNRKSGPFIAINCAAIPSQLLESELFGYERGAFTGARDRKVGKFEAAHAGTLFLDEISEMDVHLQAKMLRVLQTKQFERLGSTQVRSADVRIIAATNKNLHEAVVKKKFREDLYYRLAAFPIQIPALRHRSMDIPLLAEYFLVKFSGEHGKAVTSFTGEAMNFLLEYDWPGNVRELENAIERAVVLTETNAIRRQDLPYGMPEVSPADKRTSGADRAMRSMDQNGIHPLDEVVKNAVLNTMRAANGNISLAADILKISHEELYDLIARHDITLNSD